MIDGSLQVHEDIISRTEEHPLSDLKGFAV